MTAIATPVWVRRWTVRHRVKRLIDCVGATVVLLLALPVLVIAVMLVRMESPGPAIFRQTRVGRNGTPFTMLKLRSMRLQAEELRPHLTSDIDGARFKIRRDPRTTKVGRALRVFSIDELPQLINVLRGEMSLVGPRPALPDEIAGYDSEAMRRLSVLPGLTGLWQVSGRADLSWEESVRLDLEYVDTWCLRKDIAIMLRTVVAVISRRGAY